MNTLPIKLVNERLMFTIDYGDKLPWGSVITLAAITVEVFSGEDAHPQRVFSQVWEINGTAVTFQVRQGLPGVIYSLQTKVKFNDDWLYRDLKLAVMPDHGDVGALYPLTRIFTSLPYVQLVQDSVESVVSPVNGFLVRLLYDATTQPDNVDIGMLPVDGDLFEPPPGEFVDSADVSPVIPTDGDLFEPPPAQVKPDKTTPILLIEDGDLFIPPMGMIDPDLNMLVLVPTGGELTVVGGQNIVLLNSAGVDGSTTFIDDTGRTWTPSGNAQIDTSLGYNTMLFDGSGDWITTASSTDFDMGSGDFCIHGYIYPLTDTNGGIVSKRPGNASGWAVQRMSDGSLLFRCLLGTSWDDYYLAASASSIPKNTLTHFSVARSGTTIAMAINGVIAVSKTNSNALSNTAYDVMVGAASVAGENPYNGHIRALQIVRGSSLGYTSNYTPPATPFS